MRSGTTGWPPPTPPEWSGRLRRGRWGRGGRPPGSGAVRAARLPTATSWLRLWPETGRTHQLRAQAASRGRPILGDRAYGASRTFPCGIALHARTLTVLHPVLQTPLEWVAPLPRLWVAAGIELPEPADLRARSRALPRATPPQATLISTIWSRSVPRGTVTSAISPTFLPTSPWPIGLVRRILFWS